MNKLILSAAALLCAAQSFALVEKTEKMTVVKADGSTVEYNIADIQQITFEELTVNYPLYITTVFEDVKLTSVPKVFRMSPAEAGDPYRFGIATVECSTPEEARQGQYAIEFSVTPTAMNTTIDDLSGSNDVVVKLYRYEEGVMKREWEKQNAGSLSMTTDTRRGTVTLELTAQFDGGASVEVSFSGQVTNVDDLVGLNPPFVYVNQGQYFNYDQKPTGLFDVTGMTYKAGASAGGVKWDHQFNFTLSNGETNCYLCVSDDLVNAGEVNIKDLSASQCYFRYSSIQVASPGTPYQQEGLNGTINVVKNDDDTYVIDVTMYNKYKSPWGTGESGTPEYVIINFTGAAN